MKNRGWFRPHAQTRRPPSTPLPARKAQPNVPRQPRALNPKDLPSLAFRGAVGAISEVNVRKVSQRLRSCLDSLHVWIWGIRWFAFFFFINPRPCLPFRSFKWNPRLSALQPRLPASLLHDENRTKCAAAAPFSIHNSQAARPDISGRETHELRGTDTTVPNHNLGKSTQRQAIRERFRGSSLDCVIPETEQLACSVQASFKLTISKMYLDKSQTASVRGGGSSTLVSQHMYFGWQ